MVDSLPVSASPADAVAPEPAYGLEELLALAGEQLGEEITPRTVRLYATQGLIDRPGRDGRSAVYGRRQLLQLLLIRSLARRGLSLAAIAPLCDLPDGELAQQLAQLDEPSPLQAPAEQPAPNPALAFVQQLRQEVGAAGASAPAAPEEATAPTPKGSLLPLLGAPLSPRSPSRSGGSREAASRWHRFTLAPGVELQISEAVAIPPPGSRRTAWLNRLVARLIAQLEDGPP